MVSLVLRGVVTTVQRRRNAVLAPSPPVTREGATVERTIERLLQQAYLFDDPKAYQAGVHDAVAALQEHAATVTREPGRDDVPVRPLDPRERRSA
jgi:hypothetical protein